MKIIKYCGISVFRQNRGRTENSECLVSGRGPVCKWAGFGCQSDTESLEQKIEKEKTESGLKRRICS